MSIALELYGPKKTGHVCPREYRNGNNCPLIVRSTSEDLLTANVFGLLKHFPPQRWLAPLLNKALETDRFTSAPFKDFKIHFWKDAPIPADRAGREGPTEVDVTITFDNVTVFIEAKLNAPLSSRTAHDTRRNQLIRLIDVALNTTQRDTMFPREPIVLVVTPQLEAPNLVRRYWAPSRITHALSDLARAAAVGVAAKNLGFINWLDVPSLVEVASPVERSLVTELVCYLQRKTRDRHP